MVENTKIVDVELIIKEEENVYQLLCNKELLFSSEKKIIVERLHKLINNNLKKGLISNHYKIYEIIYLYYNEQLNNSRKKIDKLEEKLKELANELANKDEQICSLTQDIGGVKVLEKLKKENQINLDNLNQLINEKNEEIKLLHEKIFQKNHENEDLEIEIQLYMGYDKLLQKIKNTKALQCCFLEFDFFKYKECIECFFISKLSISGESDEVGSKYEDIINKTNELCCIIYYFKQKKFKFSRELSNYIVDNNLKTLFPLLTGILEMKNEKKSYIYKGALHPDIYTTVCERLGLEGQKSTSKPGKFTSYSSM